MKGTSNGLFTETFEEKQDFIVTRVNVRDFTVCEIGTAGLMNFSPPS